MRLYLLPISTRRTLLYCQRLEPSAADKQTIADKIQGRAARLWANWEQKEKGWQKKVVEYGNYALRRIPYEEWGLKSVPPLSTRRKQEEMDGQTKVEVVYPKSLIRMDKIPGILQRLGTERESLHKKRMLYCFVGMPISAPIALIPVIPNLPFFYLVYRAWSHWRALAGGKHLQFLVQNKLLTMTPSPILDEVYAKQKQPLPSSAEPTTNPAADHFDGVDPDGLPHPDGETMLLSQANGIKMTKALDLPALEVELERAIWQVETAISKQSAEEASKMSAVSPLSKQADSAEKVEEKKKDR